MQQLTRFRLTWGVARSVCGSRTSCWQYDRETLSLILYCNTISAGLRRSTIAALQHCSEFSMTQPVLLRVLVHVITWPRLSQAVTGCLSSSESCSSYVCWCIKFIQDDRHPIFSVFTTASPHQPTSLRVLVYAPPAVDVTNASTRVWSLENVRFRVLNRELGTVCHHHCMNSQLRRPNDT